MQDVEQLVGALFTVTNSLERASHRSRQAGALRLLQIIAARPGVSPTDIAADLEMNLSSITRRVRSLEESGYVSLVANPRDRRSCLITLTPAGQEEMTRLTQIGLGRFARFVAGWNAEDVQTLARLLFRFEQSKAEVARSERLPGGRRWQHES